MTPYLRVGAVIALVAIGSTAAFLTFGPGGSGSGGTNATPSPIGPEPSGSGDGSLPVGLHLMHPEIPGHGPDSVSVTIPARGWFADSGEPSVTRSVTKDLGGDDRVTVVVVPGDFYRVPKDICHWASRSQWDDGVPIPGTFDEFVALLAQQTYDTPAGPRTRELSGPVDVTTDRYPGQSITGVVPGYPHGDPSGCDQQRFCSLLDRDGYLCLLPHVEPNAVVTIWLLDSGGSKMRLAAAHYAPATGSELLAEMNAIVDSMTFHD